MNELIEHFAERATKEMDQEAFSEDMNIPVEWYHKFAELIVRECMKLNSKELSITAIERLLPLYAEHFGVTE